MFLLLLMLLLTNPIRQASGYPCLPPGVKPTDVVSAERTGGDHPRLVIVTVRQRLRKLRARCSGNRLADRHGIEIRFYRLHCFGAPTAYAVETMRRERDELAALRQRYTVVEMTCSPTGEPTP